MDYPPELFHLSEDPLELINEASNPKYEKILQDLLKKLRAFVDPEATDRRAKMTRTSGSQNLGEHKGPGK